MFLGLSLLRRQLNKTCGDVPQGIRTPITAVKASGSVHRNPRAYHRRLIRSAEPDFARLVRACLLTGMRLGELTALKVADVGPNHVTVRHSKTGSARRIPVNSEGTRFFEEAIAGRPLRETVLTQSDGTPWTHMRVSRGLRLACKGATADPE